MKKSLIFWFAAATCAAWILVGCESPTNGEKGAAGANAPGTLPSGATPAMLAALFETTDTVIVGLPLGEGTFTVPAGKTLAVAGTVDISGVNTVINAFDGTLDVSAGGFTADGDNVFIVAEAKVAEVKAAASGGIVPAYAAGVTDTPIEGYTVLPSLSIGGSGTSEEDFGDFAGSTHTVYVLGTLAIDATSAVSTGNAKLVILGETTAAGANGVTFGANTVIGTLKATGALKITAVGAGGVKTLNLNGQAVTITADDNIGVITSGAEGAVLNLPSDGSIGNIDVGAYDITIGGTPAAVTVAELAASGAGKLVLPAAAVTFTATAGGGKIAYTGAPASLTLSSTTGLTYVGNLSTGAVTLTAGNLTVSGDATFTGALAGPAGSSATITFNGETASVASYTTKATDYVDTFAGSAALTITTLTDASSASTVVFNGPLTVVTNAVTPGTGGLIIAGSGAVRLEALPTITNALSIGNTAGVFIADGLVTGSSSNTVTLTNAIFQAGDAASPISLTSAEGTGVTLGAGDALALNTNDTIVIANSGKIALGTGAEISGAGTWTAASGEDEYLAIAVVNATTAFIGASLANGNTGEEAGTLTASDGTPAITVKASGTLTIGPKTTVALGGDGTAVGSIVLTGNNSNPGKLTFTAYGSSDVGTSLVTTGNSTATNKVTGLTKVADKGVGVAIVGYLDNSAAASATKVFKLGASNETNSIVGGGDGNNATISGQTYTAGTFNNT